MYILRINLWGICHEFVDAFLAIVYRQNLRIIGHMCMAFVLIFMIFLLWFIGRKPIYEFVGSLLTRMFSIFFENFFVIFFA